VLISGRRRNYGSIRNIRVTHGQESMRAAFALVDASITKAPFGFVTDIALPVAVRRKT
jgi:hypothetical protein